MATVTYGFDTTDRAVWPSPFEGDEQARPYGSGILCRRHADALAVPKGWRVDDRREAVPRLFLAPENKPVDGDAKDATKDAARPTRQRAPRGGGAPASDLFSTVDARGDEPVLEETKAIPWSPQLLDGLDSADESSHREPDQQRGLLARAFGNKDRRDRDKA